MVDNEELEEIRKRKYGEMIQAQAGTAAGEERKKEMEEAKKNIIKHILTSEARERLNTIRMAKPEFAEQLEKQLIGLAQSGRIKSMITDTQFKELLRQIMPKKREITIRRR